MLSVLNRLKATSPCLWIFTIALVSVIFIFRPVHAGSETLPAGTDYIGAALHPTAEGKLQMKYLFPNGPKGVLAAYSMHYSGEVAAMLEVMPLKPGMTYCELGPGDGTFFKKMAMQVLPGGKAIAIAPAQMELDASTQAAIEEGVPADAIIQTLSTNEPPVSGLPEGGCDYIYSRMVYHMIPSATAAEYTKQIAKALKPNGCYFATDHDPSNEIYTRPGAALSVDAIEGGEMMMPNGMAVVPMAVEINEYQAGGLVLERVIRDWPYFSSPKFGAKYDDNGYGLVFSA